MSDEVERLEQKLAETEELLCSNAKAFNQDSSMQLEAYRRLEKRLQEITLALQPFADAYRELQHEAALANSVGHEYPTEDGDLFPVHVEHLRWAAELLGVR